MLKQIELAREFAIKHHGDQKYGDGPYVVHLDEVAHIVRETLFHLPEENRWIEIVAYLHDVVEDTDVTVEQIRAEFDSGTNHAISTAVSYVTDEPGKNRKERKAATYAKLRGLSAPYDYAPCLVKIADRLANVRACVRDGNTRLLTMYRKEHEAFRTSVYRDVPDWKRLMNDLDLLLGPERNSRGQTPLIPR